MNPVTVALYAGLVVSGKGSPETKLSPRSSRPVGVAHDVPAAAVQRCRDPARGADANRSGCPATSGQIRAATITAARHSGAAPPDTNQCPASTVIFQLPSSQRTADVKRSNQGHDHDDRQPEEPRRRHFLRSVVAARPVLQVGEPVRVRAKLRRDAPNDVLTRVGGAEGTERYLSFATSGTHRVPVTVHHRDGRIDRTEIEFEVTPTIGAHPYPILQIRQEPTNPFLLLVSVQNAEEVYSDGVTFEWRVDGYGAFSTPRPFFVIDCERFVNPTDETIPFDLHFTVNYPGRIQRTASESFRVWNDYAWSKARGVLKPRLVYDHRARGHDKELSAQCVMLNDDDEYIELTGRQIELLYDDADRVFVPGRLERLGARGRAPIGARPGLQHPPAQPAERRVRFRRALPRPHAFRPQGRGQRLFRALLLHDDAVVGRHQPRRARPASKREGGVHRERLVREADDPAAEGRRGPGDIDAGAPRGRRGSHELSERHSRERAPGLAVPDGRAGCRVADLDHRRAQLRGGDATRLDHVGAREEHTRPRRDHRRAQIARPRRRFLLCRKTVPTRRGSSFRRSVLQGNRPAGQGVRARAHHERQEG